jgi:hypothetical protein
MAVLSEAEVMAGEVTASTPLVRKKKGKTRALLLLPLPASSLLN